MQLKEYFNPYIKYIIADGRSPKTVNEHLRFLQGAIIKSLGDMELMDIRKTDIVLLKKGAERHGDHGPMRAVIVLRRLLNYIEDSGEETPFNWRDIKTPRAPFKPIKYINDEERIVIRKWLDNKGYAGRIAWLRTRTLFELLLATGMRIGEVIPLNIEDVNWETREIPIINSKTKDAEIVYLTDKSVYWLKRYLRARSDGMSCLFVSGRGRLLDVTSKQMLTQAGRAIGLDKNLNHSILRKTFVTILIEKQVHIKAVQGLARHKSPRTTLQHYAVYDARKAKVYHQKAMSQV